ncbi:MAG: hypothetical protein A2X17_05390 [Bacteroidetes bacterium GWF2_41_61]|nr:MAG: hypothetical protein A2X20_06000 [Bacteroidetes bacterium GWE2_40_15]OFY32579.1 MAG: hypothetical protein A2X17_05390 [Bacteroidetes bacterium GWF2_41_61]OFY90015.1 MAG: hypothetical protein A2266_10710 [Bacteroidetes bacterium RIFOXYA12_FULL_40_10]HBG24115.1 hypothetical protein [Rikenellaceae bacterium]HBZ26406.1 hypothetical protein [Rikenellaceae bacterium]
MEKKMGNPAAVGLAGFGLTTLLLQFHNIGLLGLGPVVAMGFIFGGIAQMIAGFQEQKMGNNFGYSAFVAYGSFWIGLGLIWIMNFLDVYKSNTSDIGYFMLVWTLFTLILFIASLRVSKAMAMTFALLLVGFTLLVAGHFGNPVFNIIAGYELIFCALGAWYMMAAIIINDLAGKIVLPVGKPYIS